MKQISWILIVCASVALSGCGMKGPLYLPDKNASVVTRPGSGNTTTTTPAAPGSTAAPEAQPGATTAPTPATATPPGDTPPKQPQDNTGDNSQSTGSTPKKN
jgi:predicted small lipoprotein YifL